MMPSANQGSSIETLGTSLDGVSPKCYTKQWDQRPTSNSIFEDDRIFLIEEPNQPYNFFYSSVNFTLEVRRPFLMASRLNFTSVGIEILNADRITRNDCLINDYYRRESPQILKDLKSRLNEIGSRLDNWDKRGSKAPNKNCINSAHIFLEEFFDSIIDNGYEWHKPFISSDEEGYVTMEWHKGKHELHIEITEDGKEFIKIWGINIRNEMHVGALSNSEFLALWDWLIHG